MDKESDYKLIQKMLDGIQIPALLVDKNHKILLQNKSAFELFNSKVGGLCWLELWKGKTLSQEQKQLFKQGKILPSMKCYFCVSDIALNKKEHLTEELYLLGRYWQSHWVAIDENIYLHYFIDITQLKENEKKIKQQERFLREITDLVPDMIWLKDTNKKYLFANKAICDHLLFAKDTNEPIGKTDLYFAQRIKAQKSDDPNYHTFVELCMDSDNIVLSTKKPGRFDESGNVAGKYLHLDVIKVPYKNESGEIIGVLGVARVVTEQKIIEKQLVDTQKQLEQSLKYHKALFENNAAGILIVDKNRIIVDANPSISKTLLYERAELVGRSASIIHKDQESFELFERHFRKLFEKPNENITIEYNFKRKDSSIVWAEVTGSLIELPSGPGIIWSAIDTTELYKTRQQLKFQAFHDTLTGLANRRYLELELPKAIERANRNNNILAACMIDLDDFKSINDTFSHEAGDIVLKNIAKRLTQTLRKSDFVVRLGGDEFVILLESIKNTSHLKKIFAKIKKAVCDPIEIKPNTFVKVGLSMGVYLYSKKSPTLPDNIMRYIDIAMYESKKQKTKREDFWVIYNNNS
ncbi:sensor domain-containing diguanylate cyclase [Desulfurella sp.]|uniref:sensor domain-containing diguanylate cyclase n=1 Tax=Desulfurella sp. TaxID=1962857 RepID=UPI003D0C6D26